MEPKQTKMSFAEFNQMMDALEQEMVERRTAAVEKIKNMTTAEYKAWREQAEKAVLTKRQSELLPEEDEVWDEVMKKRKITSCTAVDSEFIENKDDNYYDAYYMLMEGLNYFEDKAMSILNDCVSGHARLIYYYPPCDKKVQKNWKWVAEIPDGAIYVERIKG